MKSALYIGRFQPFHKGHLSVVENILKNFDKIIIVIGSAQYENEKNNPLSADEREELIWSAIKEKNLPIQKIKILKINDINDYSRWAEIIKKSVPDFQKLYTGSKIVKDCFTGKTGGKKILTDEDIVHLKRFKNISATKIRKLIKQNEKWENMVPKAVADKLILWNIKDRL